MPKIPESRLYHLLIALGQRHGLACLVVETHHDGINSWGDEYSYTTVDSVFLRDFVVFELGLRHDGDELLYVDVQALQHAKADVDKFVFLLVNVLDYQDYDSAARTYVYTEAQYDQLERDRERRKAETLARDFAARHGVEPGTEAFLDALEAEIERLAAAQEAWNDSDARFERGCRAVAMLGSARGQPRVSPRHRPTRRLGPLGTELGLRRGYKYSANFATSSLSIILISSSSCSRAKKPKSTGIRQRLTRKAATIASTPRSDPIINRPIVPT